jgi:hypothetical protein
MCVPILRQASAILNVTIQTRVETVIALWDRGIIDNFKRLDTRAESIKRILVELGMDSDSIEYWLTEYGVI